MESWYSDTGRHEVASVLNEEMIEMKRHRHEDHQAKVLRCIAKLTPHLKDIEIVYENLCQPCITYDEAFKVYMRIYGDHAGPLSVADLGIAYNDLGEDKKDWIMKF